MFTFKFEGPSLGWHGFGRNCHFLDGPRPPMRENAICVKRQWPPDMVRSWLLPSWFWQYSDRLGGLLAWRIRFQVTFCINFGVGIGVPGVPETRFSNGMNCKDQVSTGIAFW